MAIHLGATLPRSRVPVARVYKLSEEPHSPFGVRLPGCSYGSFPSIWVPNLPQACSGPQEGQTPELRRLKGKREAPEAMANNPREPLNVFHSI